MLQGTTIDELISIVERAENHAREMRREAAPGVEIILPRFFYEYPQTQPYITGVA